MQIRTAFPSDLAGILAIYNDAVLTTTAIWNETPSSYAERLAWFEERTGAGFPVLVAEEGTEIVGYGTFGPFRPHEGYRPTVEHSIYVAPAHQGAGIGKAMLRELIKAAENMGKRVMVGAIDAANDVSLVMHEAMGFREVGRMAGVGEKFGRRLDLVLMQRELSGRHH
ncbi:GNAT family N-acetyltransferase [Agaricicola taiwanensis]|nr:GNAT family N-acetyltransferase [Agaricicola taiwanensis]